MFDFCTAKLENNTLLNEKQIFKRQVYLPPPPFTPFSLKNKDVKMFDIRISTYLILKHNKG